MNGIHDMGGMEGFGPVVREQNEPVFHAEWEGRIFALTNLLVGRGFFNADEFRHAIERIPAPRYLNSAYYERWLDAVETILIEKGIASREELASRGGEPPAEPPGRFAGAVNSKGKRVGPRFCVGDRVVARNINPPGHTRLPRYARGKHGVIRRDHGIYVFPDTNAHGMGERPQHVYSVAFDGRELWGEDAPRRERVLLDLWEDYLEPGTGTAARAGQRTAKPARRRGQR